MNKVQLITTGGIVQIYCSGEHKITWCNFTYAKFKIDKVDVVRNNAISYFWLEWGWLGTGSQRGFDYLGDILSPSGCCSHKCSLHENSVSVHLISVFFCMNVILQLKKNLGG